MKIKIHVIWITCFINLAIINAQNKSDSTIQLKELIVKETPQDRLPNFYIPGSTSILMGKEIYTADGNNFSYTLHTIPGIYMHSGTYATSRIIIRGVGSRTPYNTNRIKAYLNDIPITSSDGISTVEDLDLSSIDRIEVVKGPASALYGSGLGGNINLYTSQSIQNNLNALIQSGSFNTTKISVDRNYHFNNLTIGGYISHLRSEGYRENNDYKRTSLLTSGIWQKTKYSIEYTLLMMDLKAGIPSSIGKSLYEANPKAAAKNWKDIQGFKDYQRVLAGVSFHNRLSNNWNNRLTLFGRWTDSYEKRPFNNLADNANGNGLRNKLSFNSTKIDMLLGLELTTDRYKWQIDIKEELINKNRERRNQYNFFAMIYWHPINNLNVSFGGSFNKISYILQDEFPINGDQSGSRRFPSIYSPRIGVNYSPTNWIAYYASAGHGFSLPSPEETLLPEGDLNIGIKPEKGIQYEIGTRFSLFRNYTQFDIAIYYIDLSDLLVTKRLSEDTFVGINAGKTQHKGIELTWKQSFFDFKSFPGKFTSSANYTYLHNKFIEFTDAEKNFNGNNLPGIPSQIVQMNVLWQPIQKLQLITQFQYVGAQYIDDANTLMNDAYILGNIKLDYQLLYRKDFGINLFAGINNITNTRYSPMLTVNAIAIGKNEPRYYYPGMPIHVFGGFKLIYNFPYFKASS